MNEKLLKESLEILNHKEENKFNSDSSTDLFDIAQNSLEKVGINYNKTLRKNVKNTKNKYFLELYDHEGAFLNFHKGKYPNNSPLGKKIANDKILSMNFLNLYNVKTPSTKIFTEQQLDDAMKFISSKKGHFVIKPKDLSHAIGAFRNITHKNLKNAWNESISLQKKYNVEKPVIIMQQQVEGLELRVTVTEGIVDTVSFRAPGFIIGDGHSDIETLIKNKNSLRKNNPFHKKNLLKLNDSFIAHLTSKNKSIDSVLSEGEYLILYPQTDIAVGRENYEITKHVHPNIKKQAQEAVLAIPGVHTAGVDIIVESLNSAEGTVIEVNQNPAFQMNYYPMHGEIQNPLGKVFRNLYLHHKIENKNLELEKITVEEFELIQQKYEFYYKKQKALENQIERLLEKVESLEEKEQKIQNLILNNRENEF